ncbi:MAG TPA: S8 family serine peptidase [Rubrivivax sp.]
MSARHMRLLAWLAASLVTAAWPVGAGADAARTVRTRDEAPAVRSLIVRFKGALPHHRLALPADADARDQALAVGASQQQARLQRLLDETGLGAAAGRRATAQLPAGRDQQLLVFDRALSRAEARVAVQRIAARPDVDWVEVNSRERRLQLPNDPYFADGSQWWLRAAGGSDANVLADRRRGAPGLVSAWQQTGGTGAATVVVAVLDTGITAHPDIDTSRLLPGYDFVHDSAFSNDGDGRDGDPSDSGDFVSPADLARPAFIDAGCVEEASSWHGTSIAGIVAGATDNARGAAAINWHARVLPVRVAGKCGADIADIVDGMRWAAGLPVAGVPANPNPARIVNISFGGGNPCGAAYQTAVDELKAAGVIVVAAAGNEFGAPTRPANCRGVVGVVGLNRDGFKTNYSNFGAELAASGIATVSGDDASAGARWNVLADPGILSVGNEGTQAPGSPSYYYLSGTSFAAPIVSGVASLMLSVNSSLSADQLIQGLHKSARPHVSSPFIAECSPANPGRCACTGATCGAGILDAQQALLYAAHPDSYVAPAGAGAVIDNADIQAVAALGTDRAPRTPVEPEVPMSSGGGGAMSGTWVAALGLAAALLSARRRRR